MKISELKPRQGNVEITGTVKDKGSPREFNKMGNPGKVCNAKLKDDSGEITLSLWNEQVDQVKNGDKVQIKNGYVSEWQGEMQLSTGKFGTLEVTGSSSGDSSSDETVDIVSAAKDRPKEKVMTSTELDQEESEGSDDDDNLDVEEESVD
jgi:replication factor A1